MLFLDLSAPNPYFFVPPPLLTKRSKTFPTPLAKTPFRYYSSQEGPSGLYRRWFVSTPMPIVPAPKSCSMVASGPDATKLRIRPVCRFVGVSCKSIGWRRGWGGLLAVAVSLCQHTGTCMDVSCTTRLRLTHEMSIVISSVRSCFTFDIRQF
jgi:hypothetical protein